LTYFMPYIITGLICIVLGLNEKKFGSAIFGIVTVILLWISIKK